VSDAAWVVLAFLALLAVIAWSMWKG